MEQWHAVTRDWIGGVGARPFVAIAVRAGERQVFEDGFAAFGPWLDVIDGKRRDLSPLGKAAVFTAPPCPSDDLITDRDRNQAHGEPTSSGSTSSIRCSATFA